MNKKNLSLLILVIFIFSINIHAQKHSEKDTINPFANGYNITLTSSNINTYSTEADGSQGLSLRRNLLTEKDIDGSAFFNDNWRKATITTFQNEEFQNVNIKINLQKNELYFQNDSNKILIINQGLVKNVTFFDSTIFQTGFPPINKNNIHTIYKVLTNGNYTILCHIEKVYVQSKNEMSGEQTNEFKTYTNYYTFINNEIKPFNVRKGIKNIEELIQKTDNKKFNNYVNDHSIKTINDVTLL